MAGTYELKKTANGKFMFNLKAGNGEVILTSESYNEKAGALHGIESVRKNSPDDARYERKDGDGSYSFSLKAGNGEKIGRSESYTSKAGRENGIESVKKNGPEATLKDITAA